MPNYPFLSKANATSTAESTINLPPKTRHFTINDIADQIAPKMPNHSQEEVRAMTQAAYDTIIKTLQSGKDIRMDDGSIWSLDVDGRTVLVTMPKNTK